MKLDKEPILLCLDLEEGSGLLAMQTARYSLRCNQPLHVLHVMTKGRAEKEKTAMERLKRLVDKSLPDINVEAVVIRHGLPEDDIVAYAQETSASPIVLGRRSRTREHVYVGSTTSAVISMASAPVLVIPLDRRLEPS